MLIAASSLKGPNSAFSDIFYIYFAPFFHAVCMASQEF